jgi:hypothetical protein
VVCALLGPIPMRGAVISDLTFDEHVVDFRLYDPVLLFPASSSLLTSFWTSLRSVSLTHLQKPIPLYIVSCTHARNTHTHAHIYIVAYRPVAER